MRIWELEDVAVAARLHPDTFFIPSLEERSSLHDGRLVRLHFVLKVRKPDDPRAERMWVEVIEKKETANSVTYRGVLTNQPAYIPQLNIGDIVEFGPENIAQLLLSSTDPDYLSIGEKSAFVSAMVLAPEGFARFAYREIPDRETDSGWRLFAGDESDEYVNDAGNVRVCNVFWLVDRDPSLRQILNAPEGYAFERATADERWSRALDWVAPED